MVLKHMNSTTAPHIGITLLTYFFLKKSLSTSFFENVEFFRQKSGRSFWLGPNTETGKLFFPITTIEPDKMDKNNYFSTLETDQRNNNNLRSFFA